MTPGSPTCSREADAKRVRVRECVGVNFFMHMISCCIWAVERLRDDKGPKSRGRSSSSKNRKYSAQLPLCIYTYFHRPDTVSCGNSKRMVDFDNVVDRAPGRFCMSIATRCNAGSNKFPNKRQKHFQAFEQVLQTGAYLGTCI